ncbi:MAG: hypothetical protein FWC94_06970 [Bacteroidales bacterium]|nr:hypothetical protein [Bacteroidales bacterium]
MNKYLNFSVFYFFLIYCAVYIGYTIMANYILLDDALYYREFGEIVGVENVAKLIEQTRFFQRFGYLLIPLILLIRPFYTALCLSTGALLSDQNLTFGQSYNLALKADVIFLMEIMIRINYFSIVGADSLQQINTPLFSLLHWLGPDNVLPYLAYPLGVLSIFEFIYWIMLAAFVSVFTQKSFWRSLYFILTTYGIGLILLVIAVIYITTLLS